MNSSKAASNVNNKSNRLGALFGQLEKAWPCKKSGKPEEKEFEQIRYVTNKMQQLLSSQEKCRKELLTKQSVGITMLLNTLEAVSTWDMQATLNIISCFNEVLTSGKRIGALNDHELPEVMFQTLISFSSKDSWKDSALSEDVIVLLHSVLSKIGTKEKRFAVQARMTGALQVSLNVAKQNPQNFRVLQPVLQVLKIYSNSSVNCNIMVKGAAIETLLKILPSCGQKRITTAKVTLEILGALTKSKMGAKRAVIQGAVPMLLGMFVDWHRSDHRHRQVTLRKAILTVLKCIVMINSGRKALSNIDGTKVLYNIGLEGLECKELDGVVKLIILILRRSFAKHKLPVKKTSSIFGSCDQLGSAVQLSEDEATSSEDYAIAENDFEDLEMKTDYQDENEAEFDTTYENAADNSPSKHELEPYSVFTKELLEFTVSTDAVIDSMEDEPLPDSPIKIPTATMEFSGSFYSSDESFSTTTTTNSNNGNRSFPFIRKSSSFDSGSVVSNTKHGVKLVTLSSDSDNELEMTTTSVISNPGYPKTQLPEYYSKRNRMPSVPCFPVIAKTNIDAVDFMIKGIKLHSDAAASPRDHTARTDSFSDDRMPELILNEEAVMSRSDATSESSEAMSRLDRQQPCATGEYDKDDVEHILPFVKTASPDLYGHYPLMDPEPLLEKKAGLHRHMIFQDFARFLNPEKTLNRVVYDLDALVAMGSSDQNEEPTVNEFLLSPKRSKLVQSKSSASLSEESLKTPVLQFESRFESGNLRKAIQVRQFEYDLILNPDINTDRHCQWFYFEVSNMEHDALYRFNIINCEKFNSQFNFGMQPVMYSTKDATNGNPGWERVGSNICYYKNYFQKQPHSLTTSRYYYTTTFTIKFPHANDVCYLAYHYPFTYSMMKDHLEKLELRMRSNVYYQRQKLCDTSLGNPCEMLTITERPRTDDPQSVLALRSRPYIVLTSRVHPGESCASWVMKGVLDFLTSSNEVAARLREVYIFKIVPFLNPDGVINGNHRCASSGDDLNRCWISPDAANHPTIFHTKRFIQYLNMINKTPLVYCDFHGHSRKKNVFMYGCSVAATAAAKTQGNSDTLAFMTQNGNEEEAVDEHPVTDDVEMCLDEDTGYKTLPRILNAVAPAFSIQNCSFVMEKSKIATARIVVYKDLGVARSYTCESTYCGADQGPYKGNHFGTRELEEMGKNFCVGLLKLSLSYSVKLRPEYFKQPSSCDQSRSNAEEHISTCTSLHFATAVADQPTTTLDGGPEMSSLLADDCLAEV